MKPSKYRVLKMQLLHDAVSYGYVFRGLLMPIDKRRKKKVFSFSFSDGDTTHALAESFRKIADNLDKKIG